MTETKPTLGETAWNAYFENMPTGRSHETPAFMAQNPMVQLQFSLIEVAVKAPLEAEIRALKGALKPPVSDDTTGLPPGILQAYRDAYADGYQPARHFDAHVRGIRAVLALGELLANPDNLPPYDERPRTPIGPDYHAQPGETKGHLHDVYTTRGELHGYDRIYVGSLMRSAVEDLATACAVPDKAAEREGVADAARSGCAKWGPSFPPTSCNAFEDCAHDGVCHDFDQCQIKGPAEPDDEDDANEVAALAPKPTGTEAGRGVGAETEIESLRSLIVKADDLTAKARIGEASWGHAHDANDAVFKAKMALVDLILATPTPPTPDSTGPTPRTISQETFERVRDALSELVECATLRGDNNLPHPADDPKTWTARMTEAWSDAQSALDETQELASEDAA